MKVWHRTYEATEILRSGFKDGVGNYLTSTEHSGVWVSDCPLDENDGVDGDAYLTIDVPESVLIECEWVEEGKPYREFLVPAEVAQSLRTTRVG